MYRIHPRLIASSFTKDSSMKNAKVLTAVLLSVGGIAFAGAASAEGLTRAEVRQQLIQAENDGSRFVTDTSYPDVSPVYAPAQQNQKEQSVGGALAAGSTTASGHHDANAAEPCVGPASFCTLYFGS
jgi:hypothetical protein